MRYIAFLLSVALVPVVLERDRTKELGHSAERDAVREVIAAQTAGTTHGGP